MISADFVASYIEAWNHHDAGGVAEHLADDGTYCDIPVQRQMDRDGLVTHLKDFFARDNSQYVLVGEVLTAPNSIAFQYRACPIGHEEGDAGWMGAEFITMEGETAGKIEDYYQNPAMENVRQSQDDGAQQVGIQRYAKSGLDERRLKKVMSQLTNTMAEERLHLEHDLSLPQLAEKLGCSVNHLSQAINAGFGVSFFDYINQYRVREAVEILCKQGVEAPAILNIALSVGFNSTSTFYAAFKKATGQTPAQYRKAVVKNSLA